MPSPLRRPVALAAAVACTLAASAALTPAAFGAGVPDPIVYTDPAENPTLSIAPLGSYETGIFDESGAEIVQAHGDRLFVVSAKAGTVNVLDYRDPAAISLEFEIASAGVANSVAIRADGLGVIAFEAPVKTDPGHLVFFDANAADAASAYLGEVEVGALPDMVTVSTDGSYAVVANEGEPADDFSVDPEGSVGVVALPTELAAPAQDAVKIADFHAYEAGGSKILPEDVRVFGPTPQGDDHPVSRNLEPEYIAIDGTVAYAALQEANAIAEIDLASATVTDIRPLGFKDYGTTALDASDRDPRDAPTYTLTMYPGLFGMYQPDGLNAYTANGTTYLVTANEGDAREWGDYNEVSRVGDLEEDGYGPVCDDSPLADLTGAASLGRLNVTKELGFDEAAGCYDALYTFGGRSFSIWTTDGTQVFDSGAEFEAFTYGANPAFFNSNHTEANLEGRSDDKGPEPENLAIGSVGGRTYAFIGFERVGGVMVYDITDPEYPKYQTYVNNRDFTADPESPEAGDLGPEGLAFIPADTSATGEPLLAVANEVSGTTTLFSVNDLTQPVNTAPPVISGTADVGKTLTASTGTWTPGVGDGVEDVTPVYSYQWLRDGSPIAGATTSTYRVATKDQGRALSVRVTLTQATATSPVSADSAPVVGRRLAVATVVASPTVAKPSTSVVVTVKIVATGGAKAAGKVTVKVAGKTVTGTASGGVATVTVGKLPKGVHPIIATYGGSTTVSNTAGAGVVVVR